MIFTSEDIKKHQETLDKIAQRGERMGTLTKFFAKNLTKIAWTALSLTIGGLLWFAWGYFSKLKPGMKCNPLKTPGLY
jgi:hypothetical protein